MDSGNGSIGFFDSGLGGLSVLKESIKLLPGEDYIYLGDSANAPYGTKSKEEVRTVSERNLNYLKERGAKAVVIACNTATSAAADYLRNKYRDFPIIGVEPAIKPAVTAHRGKKILVMATPMTLREKKFRELMDRYKEEAEIVPIECEGLMEFVEAGDFPSHRLDAYLKNHLLTEKAAESAAIVLGCTHYPFIKSEILGAIGRELPMYDGGRGTAKQLVRVLEARGFLKPDARTGEGRLTIESTGKDLEFLHKSKKLLGGN